MDRLLNETMLSSEKVYEGRIFDVFHDEVETPGGTDIRDYVARVGGSGVLPVDEDGFCYLVRQWRYPHGAALLEIPAGRYEEGEDARATAVRELGEETGFKAQRVFSLGVIRPTPAYSRELIHIFLATGLVSKQACLDEGEFLNVERISFEQAVDMVMSGAITDGKTQIAILKTRLLNVDKRFF